MSGQRDAGDQRWLDAESMLHRRPTSAARRRLGRSRTVRILLIIDVPLLAIAVGALWDQSGHRLPLAGALTFGPVLRAVGWVLVVLGFVLWVVGLIWMIRAGQFRLAWRSPLVNLTHGERRALMSVIRRGLPAPQGREELASYLATRTARQYPFLLWIGGLMVMDSGQAVVRGDAVLVWSLPVLVAVLPVSAVLIVRDARLASRWLASHANQDPPARDSAGDSAV